MYGELRKDIGEILSRLCDYKHIEIIEAYAMPDHIHAHATFNTTKPKCFRIYGYLKAKSTLMIFEIHTNLKYKYVKRVF